MSQPPAQTKQALGGTAIKPEGWDRSGFEAFKYFLYDPKNGTVLSRTPQSWAKITGFYLVYYSFLAAFWLLCLNIFFLTIPEETPRWMKAESLIGVNPGVGRRPANPDIEIDSSIFQLDPTSTDIYFTNEDGEGPKNIDWAQRMKKYLEPYEKTDGLYDCDTHKQDPGRCIFNMTTLGECANHPYGYIKQDGDDYIKPCIFLKLNKIYGWEPEPIPLDELDDPSYNMMSTSLKEKIRLGDDPNHVWMDCRGRYPADTEAFAVTYFPENQGFPLINFPYRGKNYHPPLVAIQLDTTQLLKGQIGQLIHIECRAWYKGVFHDTKDMAGLIRFDIHLKK